jgi:hypothetical protein
MAVEGAAQFVDFQAEYATDVDVAPQMATISECRYRWLRLPDLNLPPTVFQGVRRMIGGEIADLGRVGKGVALSRYQDLRAEFGGRLIKEYVSA